MHVPEIYLFVFVCDDRRQKEMEERLIEEEVAKRVESLVAQRVAEELEKRKDEIEAEVLRRVDEAKREMEKHMLQEMEAKREAELLAQKEKEVGLDAMCWCVWLCARACVCASNVGWSVLPIIAGGHPTFSRDSFLWIFNNDGALKEGEWQKRKFFWPVHYDIGHYSYDSGLFPWNFTTMVRSLCGPSVWLEFRSSMSPSVVFLIVRVPIPLSSSMLSCPFCSVSHCECPHSSLILHAFMSPL